MMARKGIVPNHLYKEDFVSLAKREKNARVKLRLLALSHIQKGKRFTEVAELFYVTRQALHRWLSWFEQEGVLGWYDKPGRGNKPKLLPSQEQAFIEALEVMKEQQGGGRIRCCDILQMMKEQFNIHCTLNTVYQTLARVNSTWITGRSRHPEVNLEAQEAFKKTLPKQSKSAYLLKSI